MSHDISAQANPLLKYFVESATYTFTERVISIFKFGSLGTHGDFSLCSDVDVAVMLDAVSSTDQLAIEGIWNKIKDCGLAYADRLSVFWSSYDPKVFAKGIGRFPALDRLDIFNGILLTGVDRRQELPKPEHKDLVLESAHFISSFMLTKEKLGNLILYPEIILKNGTRYLTKFVLFPVRLIFTLNHPNQIGSNKDAVDHFNCSWGNQLPKTKNIVNLAYQMRNCSPYAEVKVDTHELKSSLIALHLYCIERYEQAVQNLGEFQEANRLKAEKERLLNLVSHVI